MDRAVVGFGQRMELFVAVMVVVVHAVMMVGELHYCSSLLRWLYSFVDAVLLRALESHYQNLC